MCVMYILSPERSQMGLHPQISYFTTSPLFSGVSLVIITSIGVDRLLVVTLRLILTIRPTQIFLVNFTGGFRNGPSLLSFHDICHQRNCIVIYSNLNFVPHENVLCTSSSPGHSTTPRSPIAGRTERSKPTEYDVVQKQSHSCFLGANDCSGVFPFTLNRNHSYHHRLLDLAFFFILELKTSSLTQFYIILCKITED